VRSRQAEQDVEEFGPGRDGAGSIRIRLDELLAARGMTLTELSERVGITVVNLSVLKNGRARALRFSTLAALCAELGCQPGDLVSYEPGTSDSR
jgi:putative transcriptional regulator